MPRGKTSATFGVQTIYEQHPDLPPRCTDESPVAAPCDFSNSPEDRRHKALLRMLGHVKDAIAFPLTKRELLRAICMAGYNANPDEEVRLANAGERAMWADQDAEMLLEAASDDAPEA